MTIHKLALAALAVCSLSAPISWAQETVKMTVVHGSPESHVISNQGVSPWMQCVSETLGKAINFDYFPGGQVAKTPDLLRAIDHGLADIAPVAVGYSSDELPLNGVAMLPGLGSSSGQIVSAYSEALKNGPLHDEFANKNLIPLLVMAYPPYQVLSAKGKIDNLAAFSGKVLRSAGGSMNIAIAELGASPTEIPVGDTYVALQRGTVDGTISGLASIKPFSFHELTKSISRNGEFGTFTNVLIVRKESFEALTPEAQQAFVDCGRQIEQAMANFLDTQVEELLSEFSAQGIDVYAFPPQELSAIKIRLENTQAKWVERLAGRGLQAQEALDQYEQAILTAATVTVVRSPNTATQAGR